MCVGGGSQAVDEVLRARDAADDALRAEWYASPRFASPLHLLLDTERRESLALSLPQLCGVSCVCGPRHISRAASTAASAATGRQEAAESKVSELRAKLATAQGRSRELEVQLAALTRQSEGAKADAAADIGPLPCTDPSPPARQFASLASSTESSTVG